MSPGWQGPPSGRCAPHSSACLARVTYDGSAHWSSLGLPPAPPLSCPVLSSFGGCVGGHCCGRQHDTALLMCSLLCETPPSHLPREEPSGSIPSGSWPCSGLPPSPMLHPKTVPLPGGTMSQPWPRGELQWPDQGRLISVGRDPGLCPKERRTAVAGASPGGTQRDFLGSPLHLRQINWSQSQETHRLPGTLRAVRTAVPTPRTHAKQNL